MALLLGNLPAPHRCYFSPLAFFMLSGDARIKGHAAVRFRTDLTGGPLSTDQSRACIFYSQIWLHWVTGALKLLQVC